MNKLFTKIATACVGLAMAVGVGVAVGNTSVQRASAALASPYSITIDNNASGNNQAHITSAGQSSITHGDATWSLAATWTGEGSYIGDSKSFAQWGSKNKPAETVTISSSSFANKTVKNVTVNGYVTNNAGPTISISAAGTSIISDVAMVKTTATDYKSATDKSIDMGSTGQIVITITNPNTTKGSGSGIIIVSISVNWQEAGTTNYTLTYDVGTNGTYDGSTTKSFSVAENTSATLKTPAAVGFTANAGYIFSKWYDGANYYDAGDSYPMGTSNHTLTAQWVAGVGLSYNPVSNSGTGTGEMSTTYVVSGGTQTVAACTFNAPSGKTFSHWNTSADDKGTTYAPAATITNYTSAITLYAIWEEATVYTLVTDVSTLTDGTTFVLVSYQNSTYYVSSGLNDGHAKLISKTNNTTISNGTSNGSTLISSETQEFTLKSSGSSNSWKIKYGDSYLKFTGASNGNDSFDTEANASTFSASIKEGGYILFTCTSQTGNGRVWRAGTGSTKDMRNYATNSGVSDAYMFALIPAAKTIAGTRLNTTNGSITANIGDDGWNVSGFVFEVQYEGESSWNAVSPEYTVTESVPYDNAGNHQVHFKVTYDGNDYHENTEFTAVVSDTMTPICDFYNGEVTVTSTATANSYTYRGTVIAIEGNSYYIQQGEYGILVYGGSTTYATGMKVGDLVVVKSKIINYNNYVVESNSITNVDEKTCRILGDGTLPTAPIVTTVEAFEAKPQSTRVTFNGLSRNDKGTSITWKNSWSQGSSHGVAQVKDSTGATTYLYVSKYLEQNVGSAVVAKINQIGENDTFDVFQGVMAVNTNNTGTFHSAGTKHLSITDANQITIHTPEEDPIQTWIDNYMYLEDDRFEGDGTGLCLSQNFYVNAKAGLKAVEQAHKGSIAKFEADAEGDYADALARYKKWAIACNDGAPFDGNATIVTPARAAGSFGTIANDSTSTTSIIVIVSLIGVTAIGGYFFLRKKKHQ